MLVRSVREADQNFSEIIAQVERGETVLLTKDGRTVAEIRPAPDGPMNDPAWRETYERMLSMLAAKPRTGYPVGRITEEDKYGDAPL